jgi:hypothetical protein
LARGICWHQVHTYLSLSFPLVKLITPSLCSDIALLTVFHWGLNWKPWELDSVLQFLA